MSTLEALLKKHNLQHIASRLSTAGFSVHLLKHIPSDEQSQLCEQLQISGIDRILFRSLLNSLTVSISESKDSYESKDETIQEPPRKRQKTNTNHSTINGNDNTNTNINGSSTNSNNNNTNNTYYTRDPSSVLTSPFPLEDNIYHSIFHNDMDLYYFIKVNALHRVKSAIKSTIQLYKNAKNYSITHIKNIYYKHMNQNQFTNQIRAIAFRYKSSINGFNMILSQSSLKLEQKIKCILSLDKQMICLKDISLLCIVFHNVKEREPIYKFCLKHATYLCTLKMVHILYDDAFKPLEHVPDLLDGLQKVTEQMKSVARWIGLDTDDFNFDLRKQYIEWKAEQLKHVDTYTNGNDKNINENDKKEENSREDSNKKGRFCVKCNSYVPSGIGNWTLHVKGKRHNK